MSDLLFHASARFGSPVGEAVDGTRLEPGILPSTGYDGDNLLASNPSEASAVLFQQIGPALTAARGESLSVLVTPTGLAVSTPRWIASTDELAPIVAAGVALSRSLR